MTTEAQVLKVSDLARMLGRTEASIRSAINRDDTGSIPPRLNMGRRICWRRSTVEAWLRDREQAQEPAKAGGKGEAAE
jgi:predicted DNA-binding transcriptional regulator AlpA